MNKYTKYSIIFILGLALGSLLAISKPKLEFINCTEDTVDEIYEIMEGNL